MAKVSGKAVKAKAPVESIEEKYVKLEHREHVLKRPGMYIGPTDKDTHNMWIYDNATNRIVQKTISFTPGFCKLFDEALVNARDHTIRDPTCKTIKVNIDINAGSISLWNDGEGIDVVVHKEHKIYVPELIFGNLMAGTNFSEKKTVGGKNGIGGKAIAIFSKKFIIETVDSKTKQKYVQEFRNNMADKDAPVITKNNDKSYTKITYYPDFDKFSMKGLEEDVVALMKKRVYDVAACSDKKVKVYLDEKLLEFGSFKDYIAMHYSEPVNIIYEEIGPRWKVGVVYDNDNEPVSVSFVNGIWTYQGGTHVAYIMDQITKQISALIKKKHKIVVKPTIIKERLSLFIDSVIDDPDFNSQTKEFLTTKAAAFGSACDIPEGFIAKIIKTGIMEDVVKYAQFKEQNKLKTTDGKKVSSIRGIDKLDDALLAGTKQSDQTTLILTEGDSAKATGVSGIEVLGNDKYGVFPLRGKVLNVRKKGATTTKIQNNKELNDLKIILGLKHGVTYTDTSKLRYGHILILTDQDADGSHIKGLIINMFQYFWPSLLLIPGFIQTISTPLLKAFKKTDAKKQNPKVFYAITDFNKWVKAELNGDVSKWNIKYYKGLGTSTSKEAKEIFVQIKDRLVTYEWDHYVEPAKDLTVDSAIAATPATMAGEEDTVSIDEASVGSEKSEKNKNKKVKQEFSKEVLFSKSYQSLRLAFADDEEDNRKKWLTTYDPNNNLEYTQQKVTISEFVNKDLIIYSNYANIRMIPSLCDGQKPAQRKVLFGMFKKKIQQTEIKVSQLASYVAEHTAYKHGEISLQETIIGMAQRYTGTNNINLLNPTGAFGTRKGGGEDAASPRYIFTYEEPITRKIFRKEDDPILNYIEDEGESIEPEFYAPIIPMVLVNGANGVGTGYSTNIPSFNPIDIINYLLKRLKGQKTDDLIPWFRGFKGKVQYCNKENEQAKYKISGIWSITGDKIHLSELPVRGLYCSSERYKKYLDSLMIDDKGKEIESIILDSYVKPNNNDIHIDITFKGNNLQQMIKQGNEEIEKFLKICTSISTNNYHLHNAQNKIAKYKTYVDILDEYFAFRIGMYEKRKAYMLSHLLNDLEMLKYKVKFIQFVLEDKIIIKHQKRDDIIAKIEEYKFPKLAQDDAKSYNYIINISLFSLTKEKIDELNKDYAEKIKEYEEYLKTTSHQLWIKELEELLAFYPEWIEEQNFQEASIENGEPAGKIKKPRKKDLAKKT
jgi:DNA topoisomerase-2